MVVLSNVANGTELKISDKAAKRFFGNVPAGKKFICLPMGSPEIPPVNIQVTQDKVKIGGTCVIRMGGIGDLILLSSGLRELKRRLNDEPLSFATLPQHQAFMESLGLFEHVIPVDDIDGYEFDKVIDCRFAVEPPELGTHTKGTWDSYTMEDRSDAFDKLLGVYPCPKRFEIPVDDSVVKRMSKKLPREFILLTAAMDAPARSIPLDYIKPFVKLIGERLKKRVVMVGRTQEWNSCLKNIDLRNNGTNLIDQTTIPELIAICYLASIIVAPDTGTVHIGGALKKKTVAIFGNINARTRISYYQTVKALYPHGEMKCLPCWDLHPCTAGKRPEESVECMKLTTPEMIVETIEGVL